MAECALYRFAGAQFKLARLDRVVFLDRDDRQIMKNAPCTGKFISTISGNVTRINGICLLTTFSNSRAGPFAFITRSVISAISSSALTGVVDSLKLAGVFQILNEFC